MTKTWLITGASRGVAAGRNPDTVPEAVGAHAAALGGRRGRGRGFEDEARLLLAQVVAHRELSTSLAHEDAKVAA